MLGAAPGAAPRASSDAGDGGGDGSGALRSSNSRAGGHMDYEPEDEKEYLEANKIKNESLIEKGVRVKLPTEWGDFDIVAYKQKSNNMGWKLFC